MSFNPSCENIISPSDLLKVEAVESSSISFQYDAPHVLSTYDSFALGTGTESWYKLPNESKRPSRIRDWTYVPWSRRESHGTD